MASMRNISFPIRRIPHSLRPLRPPNAAHPGEAQRPRHFTQNSHKLLLVSSSTPRPQLPFLHNSASSRLAKVTIRTNISRLISTERKTRWKRNLRWQFRFHLFFWPAITLLAVAGAASRQLWLEQEYPTPPDWSVFSRWILRNRKEAEFGEENKIGAINWEFLGIGYKQLLERLEKGPDSEGVTEVDEGGILIDGLGKAGYDVSAKSAPWKQGYYEALMGTARVAENLDGWVKQKGSNGKSYPKEMIASPDNPNPAPVPNSWRGKPPTIEDCEEAFESPAVFYTRVLTTKGLTNRMKTDAAMAWAEWLDFKSLHETAEEVLKWGIDIAAGGMKVSHRDEIIDPTNGAFKPKLPTLISENMLKSNTALAVHHARSGNPEKALPVFLSIMRVRKDLAPSMPARRVDVEEEEEGIFEGLWSLIRGPGFPPVPDSGDQPPSQNLKEACEQTGIMTYIGEILYALSSKEDGLSWTRDAVDGAETVLWAMDERGVKEGKEKCEECLETGLLNWQQMAAHLAKEAAPATSEPGSTETKSSSGSSWFGFSKKRDVDGQRWQRELEQVSLRIERTKPLMRSRFGQVEIPQLKSPTS